LPSNPVLPEATEIAIVNSPYRYGVKVMLHIHHEEALCNKVVSLALRLRCLYALGLY